MNVISPQVMSKEAMPHLRKVKGNIVFISSIAGERVYENHYTTGSFKIKIFFHHLGHSVGQSFGGYCASKAALTHLAKAMALEEAPNDVRINIISPGAILSEMLLDAVKGMTGQDMKCVFLAMTMYIP